MEQSQTSVSEAGPDQRREATMLWRGLVALVLVLMLAYARQRWWL